MSAFTRSTLRVVLLDDDANERTAAETRIGNCSGLQLVAAAAEPEDALRLALHLRADAVLVNTQRCDGRGLDAIALLTSLAPAERPAIVMYVEMRHLGGWPDVRALGADDIILKELIADILRAELLDVVVRVHGERHRRPWTEDVIGPPAALAHAGQFKEIQG
jgi:DNA-binding NarL/FixJ family response regulator